MPLNVMLSSVRRGLADVRDATAPVIKILNCEGRLDALLGRATEPVPHRPHPDKGSHKGSSAKIQGKKRPYLSSDRANESEVGTAYRNRRGGPEGSG